MKQVLLAAFASLSLLACNDSSTNHMAASNDSTGGTTNHEANSKEAKEERNKQTALASENAVEKGDVDGMFKDADKDFAEYGDGSMKPIKGVDSIKSFMKQWVAAIPDYRGSDFTAVADGNEVMVYGTWKGTWKNALMGQKATGKSFKVQDVDFFKFNDSGKIVEHRNVIPMSEIARQTGMKMPAETKQ